MRDIFFRAKRCDNKEWIKGFYVKFDWADKTRCYIIPSHASACCPIEVFPETVGQYLGKDKNRLDIFEGDFCKVVCNGYDEDDLFIVKYDEDETRFVLTCENYICNFSNFSVNEVEVIGNSYDD